MKTKLEITYSPKFRLWSKFWGEHYKEIDILWWRITFDNHEH